MSDNINTTQRFWDPCPFHQVRRRARSDTTALPSSCRKYPRDVLTKLRRRPTFAKLLPSKVTGNEWKVKFSSIWFPDTSSLPTQCLHYRYFIEGKEKERTGMYEAKYIYVIITVSFYQMLPANCCVINQNVVFLPQDRGERDEYLALFNNSTSVDQDNIRPSQWSVTDDSAVLKITPAKIREKISRKTRKLLKKLRFMYKDYEPEMDIAMCYVKYFELIPGLTMSKRSADDGRSQDVIIVKDIIASLKIIGRYLLTSLENMFNYFKFTYNSLRANHADQSVQDSDDSHINDEGYTVDRNAERVTFYDVVSGSLSALYNSVFGNLSGGGAQQWFRKSVEIFNTHKLVLCTRHYILDKMWDWVDAGTVLD